MSKIDFKSLVEQLLTESLGDDMLNLLAMPGVLTLEKCAVWASMLDKTGGRYIKRDELIGLKPAFPIIDTLFCIFKILQNTKVVPGINEQIAIQYAEELKKTSTIKDFFEKIEKKSKVKKSDEEKQYIINSLESSVENLFNNFDNYRDFCSLRLKQTVDLTQTLAAEEYLNLSPYQAIVKLLQEYGGYDLDLIENILFYPGETRYTQKIDVEGPILKSIIEISKLMLIFYREYIIEQKEKTGHPIINSVMEVLNIKSLQAFKNILDSSAGKLSPQGDAGRKLQQDYIKFVKGESIFTIDPNVLPPIEMPMDPPKPAIRVVSDFENIAGTSQEIYQEFIFLFNNIRKGTFSTDYLKTIGGVIKAIGGLSTMLKPVN